MLMQESHIEHAILPCSHWTSGKQQIILSPQITQHFPISHIRETTQYMFFSSDYYVANPQFISCYGWAVVHCVGKSVFVTLCIHSFIHSRVCMCLSVCMYILMHMEALKTILELPQVLFCLKIYLWSGLTPEVMLMSEGCAATRVIMI